MQNQRLSPQQVPLTQIIIELHTHILCKNVLPHFGQQENVKEMMDKYYVGIDYAWATYPQLN